MMHLRLHYTHFLTQLDHITKPSVSKEILRGCGRRLRDPAPLGSHRRGRGWIPVLT